MAEKVTLSFVSDSEGVLHLRIGDALFALAKVHKPITTTRVVDLVACRPMPESVLRGGQPKGTSGPTSTRTLTPV